VTSVVKIILSRWGRQPSRSAHRTRRRRLQLVSGASGSIDRLVPPRLPHHLGLLVAASPVLASRHRGRAVSQAEDASAGNSAKPEAALPHEA